ncbi:hypothetical protein HED22_07230 [Thalassospira sp. HF15]|uniref:hypothetical protein n=1 Tax=Thalassospira sp. HF15 TaxID=2722755 RepID=UPI0014305E0D|nr:hypothetical protein [Thalassospira sp. HF15]NIY75430.1 hypothetical protein [Thalassospira sp. HF15]
MRIQIYVEHDIVVRHFVYSGVFERLIERGHDVSLILPDNAPKRISTFPNDRQTSLHVETVPMHPGRRTIWKKLFLLEKFRYRFDPAALNTKKAYAKLQHWKANILFSLFALPLVRQFYIRLQIARLSRLADTELFRKLEDEQPDLVVHPSVLDGVFFDDLISFCGELGIPLINIMNSWDNPSIKHGAVNNPDCLLVWGRQTHQHAVKYMGMRPENVKTFGVAQFDVYRNPPRISKAEFCAKHGLNEDCRILLYAGSSKGTDETAHLHMIDEFIDQGDLPPMKVIYRPHPWGNGGANGEGVLEQKWKHVVIESSMVEYLQSVKKGTARIFLADYRDTHDVLSNIDFLISPLSTIILEAALHGKPAMCYMPVDEKEATHFQAVKDMPHFDDLFQMDVFPKAFGESELRDGLAKLIELSEKVDTQVKLAKACNHFIEPFDQSWANRFTDFVEEYAARKIRN